MCKTNLNWNSLSLPMLFGIKWEHSWKYKALLSYYIHPLILFKRKYNFKIENLLGFQEPSMFRQPTLCCVEITKITWKSVAVESVCVHLWSFLKKGHEVMINLNVVLDFHLAHLMYHMLIPRLSRALVTTSLSCVEITKATETLY